MSVDPSQRHRWIEENAYFHWVNEQFPDGQHLRHWLEAEAEFEQLKEDIHHMSRNESPNSRLVYLFPRICVASRRYGEHSVHISKAAFYPDEPATWETVLKLPRPEWLDIFREFPGVQSEFGPPARGTLLISSDDVWLRKYVNQVLAILFVIGVEENRWELPSEAFQHYGFNATRTPHEMVALNTKTRPLIEDTRSLQVPPPIELRAVTKGFRVDVHDESNRKLIERFDANSKDRLAVACYHLFRTQFDNPFTAPSEQDYSAYCACLEAALNVQGPDYGKEIGDKMVEIYPHFPDLRRWVAGLYSERSVFNHGQLADESAQSHDDRMRALFEFRARRLSWDTLRHVCLDVIRDQLRDASKDIARLMSRSTECMRKLFSSDALWLEVAKVFTRKQSVQKICAMTGEEEEDFLELCCAYLNGHNWQVAREAVNEKRVYEALAAMAAVIGECAQDKSDKEAAEALFQAAKNLNHDAIDSWAREHAVWENGRCWESKYLAAKAVAVRTARYFVR